MLESDTIFYHRDGLCRVFAKGGDRPGAGWDERPFHGVSYGVPETPEMALAIDPPRRGPGRPRKEA